ncbi:MAG: hypothetical protein IPM18_16215 [Phycisphaerales bacterium]|nr:hypothetical protein [Phycisphaerales bacterium]
MPTNSKFNFRNTRSKTSRTTTNFGGSQTTGNRPSANQPTYSTRSPKFRAAQNEVQWRIGSYRNIQTQFSGPGVKTPVSPTTVSKWIKYVNNGVQVYKFTNKQFQTYFGAKTANSNPTVVRKQLATRFGASIKDVTRGKGNTWLIAATRTPTARPFANYPWK